MHRYPLSSYGFDNRVGFSITDPGKSFLGALQSLAAMLWMGIVFLLKGVLLLLEWTFALDLTGEAMPASRRTMERLHQRAFGEPWLLAAISIAGLWGIWRGLVPAADDADHRRARGDRRPDDRRAARHLAARSHGRLRVAIGE